MKRLAFVTVILLLIGISFHANAQEEKTGIQLLNECKSVDVEQPNLDQMILATSCMSYLKGVMDTLVIWDYENTRQGQHLHMPVCIPTEVTMDELTKVIVKFLNDHPNELHRTYRILVIVALRDAYQCKPATK